MADSILSLSVYVLRLNRMSTLSANETRATWNPFGVWSVRIVRDWTTAPTNSTTRAKLSLSMLPEASSANTMSPVESLHPATRLDELTMLPA